MLPACCLRVACVLSTCCPRHACVPVFALCVCAHGASGKYGTTAGPDRQRLPGAHAARQPPSGYSRQPVRRNAKLNFLFFLLYFPFVLRHVFVKLNSTYVKYTIIMYVVSLFSSIFVYCLFIFHSSFCSLLIQFPFNCHSIFSQFLVTFFCCSEFEWTRCLTVIMLHTVVVSVLCIHLGLGVRSLPATEKWHDEFD